MNKPPEEILAFMKTDAYADMPFTEFVRKFTLNSTEFKNLIREHVEDSSLRILSWDKNEIIVG